MPSMLNSHRQKIMFFTFNLLTNTYLALTYIVVSSNSNLHELATIKEERLAFYIKWQQHYNFDVKVECCGFVDFVNDVIDCGCLGCVFCF